jgi:hypothetical protein
MCNFQSASFECRGDGYLWDADSDGWDPADCDYPCPQCNTRQYLLDAKEDAESFSEGRDNDIVYTGESSWLNAVRYAELVNLADAKLALAEIGVVQPLRPARNAAGYEAVQYLYT